MIIHDSTTCLKCGACNEYEINVTRQGEEVILNCGNCDERMKSRYFYSTHAPCERTPDTQ